MSGEKPDDLMARREIAGMFGVTSEAVARWSRRDPPLLHEIREDGRPRYRRSEVEALYASGFRGGPSPEPDPPAVQEMHGARGRALPDLPHSSLCRCPMTSHRKPGPKWHLPSICLPSLLPVFDILRTISGCSNNRIWWFKTGWYVDPPLDEFEEWP